MKMLIGGMEVDASNKAVMNNVNPATGKVIDTVPSASPEDLERTISNAVEGQKEWAAIPFHKRMGNVHFNVLFDDFFHRAFGHFFYFVESLVYISNACKHKTAFRNI